MPTVVVRPTPESCALTPRRRLLGTGPRSHLNTLKSMLRSVATARTLMPPSKPRLDPHPTARMTSRTPVRNQRSCLCVRPSGTARDQVGVKGVGAGEAREGSGFLMTGSVFWKSSKGLPCIHIPPHSRYGISPPTLHALQGAFVRFITPGDHIFQVAIFRLYDLVSRIPMEWGIAWSTHLFTRHRFHICQRPSVRDGGELLSSPLSSRARRFVPRRRQSTPSERRRSATWRLRRGSPCR